MRERYSDTVLSSVRTFLSLVILIDYRIYLRYIHAPTRAQKMTGPDKLTLGNMISRELTSSVPQSHYVQRYRNEAKANESQGKEEQIVSNRFILLQQSFTEIGRESLIESTH